MATRSWLYVIFIVLLPNTAISSEKIKESGEKIDLQHAKDKYKLKGKIEIFVIF